MELLAKGANPNVVDKRGNTLLHTIENPEMLKALLSYGAEPNVINKVVLCP